MYYLDGICVKTRCIGRRTLEGKPEDGPEYLTRWGPELNCSMHILGWISVSKVVSKCALDCVYKLISPLWIDRQASWIRIQEIHTLFLLDFTHFFVFPFSTLQSVRLLPTCPS